MNGTTVKIKRD